MLNDWVMGSGSLGVFNHSSFRLDDRSMGLLFIQFTGSVYLVSGEAFSPSSFHLCSHWCSAALLTLRFHEDRCTIAGYSGTFSVHLELRALSQKLEDVGWLGYEDLLGKYGPGEDC